MDDVITEFDDKLFNFCSRGNGLEITVIEIKGEFLTEYIFVCFIW